MILLQAPEGQTYIRTDQLDGETDWKARKAAPNAQKVSDPKLKEIVRNDYRVQMRENNFVAPKILIQFNFVLGCSRLQIGPFVLKRRD